MPVACRQPIGQPQAEEYVTFPLAGTMCHAPRDLSLACGDGRVQLQGEANRHTGSFRPATVRRCGALS